MKSLNRLSLWTRLLRLSLWSRLLHLSSWSRLLHLSSWSHVVAIGSMAILAACGGDSGSDKVAEPAEATDLVAETFDDLPVCSDKREGATAYVKDEKNAYVCIDGDWALDGTPSSSATDAPSSSSATTEELSSSGRN